MKTYKDANNKLFAYEADGSQDHLINAGLTLITEAEATSIRTPAPLTLAELKALLTLKIDADIDAIYEKVVGNRFAEYQDAANEAKAFKEALYLGTAGASVTAWATVKGMTATWAADDILATASAWKGAQVQMRSVRLQHKENARVAPNNAQIAAVDASWKATLIAIKTSLGIN